MKTLGTYYDWANPTSPEGWKGTLHFKGDGGYYKVAIYKRLAGCAT
jgi:hypothetical protein